MQTLNITKIATLIIALFVSTTAVADSMLSPMTDAVNSGIINTKMETNDSLNNIHIDATVINGVAIYSGEVNSKEQLETLIRIAQSVSGIKGVDTAKVKVKSH